MLSMILVSTARIARLSHADQEIAALLLSPIPLLFSHLENSGEVHRDKRWS